MSVGFVLQLDYVMFSVLRMVRGNSLFEILHYVRYYAQLSTVVLPSSGTA